MASTTSLLRRRTARLARCFQLIAAAAGAAGVAVACGSHASGDGTADAGAGDASGLSDSTAGPDAGDAAISDARAAGEIDVDAAPSACGAIVALNDATTDAEDICDYTLTCGLQKNYGLTHVGCTVVPADPYGNPIDADGFLDCSVREALGCTDGNFVAPDGGSITFQCYGCFGGGGRRPPGLVRVARGRARGWTLAGAHFAEMARLEAASVHAFDRLAGELADHRAPRRLVDAATESARDEERHAAAMDRLARRFGAKGSRAHVRHVGRRSLATIARENAVEGCVRETFGALVNTWQAMHARDADVRSVLAAIARDETRHAALSWEIAAWAETRLTPTERRSIDRARRRAIATLASEIAAEAPRELRQRAGLPDAAECARMMAELGAHVWGTRRVRRSDDAQRRQSTA